MQNTSETADRARLLAAVLPHVPFDGWSESAFAAGAADLGLTPDAAKSLCPRGAVDLAVDYHKAGDQALAARVPEIEGLRYSEKVAALIRFRLEDADREVVRRGTTLFALPQNAALGASLIWGTADAIWTALGDTSDDINWYSKRAILSGVYGSVVLYWLGDETGGEATAQFIDRRIAEVMQFEKFKSGIRANPALRPLSEGLGRLFSSIRAPRPNDPRNDLPGIWAAPKETK